MYFLTFWFFFPLVLFETIYQNNDIFEERHDRSWDRIMAMKNGDARDKRSGWFFFY